jgi:hypothetical protein
MTEREIDTLIAAIKTAIDAEGNWKRKREQILMACGSEDRTAIEEFASWFEVDDHE